MNLAYKIYPVDLLLDSNNRIKGSNHKGVLLAYDVDDKDHLDFLSKILSAVQLDFDKILTLEMKGRETFKIPTTIDNRKIDTVIIFGLNPKQLCINFLSTIYKIEKMKETKFLFADNLYSISTSKELKKKLWLSLKELFEV
ncbi:MAG: hypothetical protein ACI94Y_000548 [Maribacter sp.]|jgi:hypothetical protein